MTRRASQEVYKKTGITPDKVQVVELHDCFSANELCTYEALGLCEVGKAGEAIDRNDFTYGGRVVVNPSGGLISKGHPLGATGLAQCAELCWQLRGMADKRQVNDVKYALQHNLGLGGACVVIMYGRLKPRVQGWTRPNQTADLKTLEKMEVADKKVKAVKPKL
jgi:sterol carrier protein 2